MGYVWVRVRAVGMYGYLYTDYVMHDDATPNIAESWEHGMGSIPY